MQARWARLPAEKVEKIFDLMEQFAGYGFNKSHSAAYAYLAFVTAYLKATIGGLYGGAAHVGNRQHSQDRQVHQRMSRNGD
jgi:DNA polymerase III alpha subunit